MSSLQDVHEAIASLKNRIDALVAASKLLHPPLLAQTEWYPLITQKLLPQLSNSSYAVVAVVGGTNIGKSVLFNHLCNARVSATSPLASGTKHPTCVAPPRLAEQERLAEIFGEFAVVPSDTADDALAAHQEDRLFWRESTDSPNNLLLLDTPDIDSDAEVNWKRADKVRRASDVLIAVLTQQKYNDAAVKTFFRVAAEEDKVVVVVFNQCLLPEDEEYWPVWLKTFCDETGVDPEFVYLAPHDRRAAEDNRLPFYSRDWPVTENTADDDQPRSLMKDLSSLRFEEIKLRTLSGAIHLLRHSEQGIPNYLKELRRRAGVHGDAWNRLTERMQEVRVTWPTVPNRVVIEEMRSWWREQRTGWEASVHGFYDAVGNGILWPFRQLTGQNKQDGPPEWLQRYRQQEWTTIQQQLAAIYDRLESLANHGNPVLTPQLNELMTGQSREQLLDKMKAEHANSAIEEDLHQLVHAKMKLFREERADSFKLLKRVDTLSAAARPAVTVALFATGFGPVGQAVMPVVTDTALQAAIHVASDVTAGTVTAAVGDTALAGGTSAGVRYLEAWFLKLHQDFVAERQSWVLRHLQTHLWGDLLADLQAAAALPRQPEFAQAEEALAKLGTLSLSADG
ncbi:MAG: hypothetical protein CMJ47_06410 [Planctomyces sp.]|nr:hypothetical protein [Planctomyces sp.]